jgi:hypothetical protein
MSFSQHNNQKFLKEIFLGSECEEHLKQLMVTENINVVTNIREHCLEFYITAAEEICKKLPVNNKFLSALKVFLPQIALNDTDRNASFSYNSFISRTMGGFDETNELCERGESCLFTFARRRGHSFASCIGAYSR